STDKRCGMINGKLILCPDNLCCGKDGYCGTNSACESGCQPFYGRCNGIDSPKIRLSSKGECGEIDGQIVMCPNNSCCSKYGSCDYKEEFCGKGCQPAFGKCNGFESPKITFSVKGECGIHNEKITLCPNNSCCSKYGSCDYKENFCGVGCQPAFGLC
ncbi:carbohydrate-binding module family 18 protein, partial [Piromyces sp. E2]